MILLPMGGVHLTHRLGHFPVSWQSTERFGMANDDQKSGGNDAPTKPTIENSVMGKAIAAVFVTVLAPILVAVGMKYSDNIVANINARPAAPNDTATKTEPAVTKPASADAAKPPSAETASS